MDKMMEQINQILNDPESMKQISQMASALGEKTNAGENTESVIPPGITKMIGQVQQREEKQQALVRALLPYLQPRHQARLERAIQIARMSHLAGAALRTENFSGQEETEHDV